MLYMTLRFALASGLGIFLFTVILCLCIQAFAKSHAKQKRNNSKRSSRYGIGEIVLYTDENMKRYVMHIRNVNLDGELTYGGILFRSRYYTKARLSIPMFVKSVGNVRESELRQIPTIPLIRDFFPSGKLKRLDLYTHYVNR